MKKAFRLSIGAEYFHGNAALVERHYSALTEPLRAALQSKITLDITERKKGAGVGAEQLNDELKALVRKYYLDAGSPISEEVFVSDGRLLTSQSAKGFDFGLFDKERNLYVIRNLCLGKRRYATGATEFSQFLADNPEYRTIWNGSVLATHPDGVDASPLNPRSATILGEIQFGNWALLFRDFFKALDALENPGFDLFVYVCAHGKLQKMLSEGIVCYKEACSNLQLFAQVLRFPIWVIGVDFKEELE